MHAIFLEELFQNGCRQFCCRPGKSYLIPGCNILKVRNQLLAALQSIARIHRSNFYDPVIGITGSNSQNDYQRMYWGLFVGSDYAIVKTKG